MPNDEFDQEEVVERAWRARWASTAEAFARSTLSARAARAARIAARCWREVSERERRRRGVVEEARGEATRGGVDVGDETSDILG